MHPSPYSAGLARHFEAFFNAERAARYVELLLARLPAEGHLLDIGAGLGHMSLGVAAAGRTVWALEPDADMRTVLQTQLLQHAARERLTPLPWAAGDGCPDLPVAVDAACAFSLLHLLEPAQQQGLLAWTWRQLRHGGTLVLELPMQGPERQPGDWQANGRREIGASRLSMRTRLQGSDAQGWTTDWDFELRLGDRVIEQARQQWTWRAFAPDALQDLLAGLPGLRIEQDWADELGTPYSSGQSARRLLVLRKD